MDIRGKASSMLQNVISNGLLDCIGDALKTAYGEQFYHIARPCVVALKQLDRINLIPAFLRHIEEGSRMFLRKSCAAYIVRWYPGIFLKGELRCSDSSRKISIYQTRNLPRAPLCE
jgi:hypothetical protein